MGVMCQELYNRVVAITHSLTTNRLLVLPLFCDTINIYADKISYFSSKVDFVNKIINVLDIFLFCEQNLML